MHSFYKAISKKTLLIVGHSFLLFFFRLKSNKYIETHRIIENLSLKRV
jgi:hypothetical protein